MSIRNKFGIVALSLGLLGTATVVQAAKEIELRSIAPAAAQSKSFRLRAEGYIYERGHYMYDGKELCLN
jgi:hypothetical protein